VTEVRKSKKDVTSDEIEEERVLGGDDTPKRKDAGGTLASGDKAPKEEGKRDIEQRVLSKSKEIEGDSSKRGDC
jgi:hypothetical protein